MTKLFNYFKRNTHKQSSEIFDVATIVQRMFDEAGIVPHHQDDIFMTVIDGTNASFNTILKCDSDTPNSLFVYVPFPIAVPRHVADLIPYELNRLNDGKHQAEITMQERDGEYSIFAFTCCEFDKEPTTDDVRKLMVQTVDLMDNDHYRSLTCAIVGYATYEELENAMISNAEVEGRTVTIEMSDGYNPLLYNAKNMTKARYSGRLLMLSIHIIENKISQQRAQELLRGQIPLSNIIQEAYNIANDIERDVIRKLLYLTLTKAMNIGSDNDSLLGRLEAIARIAKNIYSLLDGVNMSE